VQSTTGQSQRYPIQAQYQDQDTGSTVLPYYNASNAAVAYNGPANSGLSQNMDLPRFRGEVRAWA